MWIEPVLVPWGGRGSRRLAFHTLPPTATAGQLADDASRVNEKCLWTYNSRQPEARLSFMFWVCEIQNQASTGDNFSIMTFSWYSCFHSSRIVKHQYLLQLNYWSCASGREKALLFMGDRSESSTADYKLILVILVSTVCWEVLTVALVALHVSKSSLASSDLDIRQNETWQSSPMLAVLHTEVLNISSRALFKW